MVASILSALGIFHFFSFLFFFQYSSFSTPFKIPIPLWLLSCCSLRRSIVYIHLLLFRHFPAGIMYEYLYLNENLAAASEFSSVRL